MAEEILVLKLKLDAQGSIQTTDDLIERNKELVKLMKQVPLEGKEGYAELEQSLLGAKKEYAANKQVIDQFNTSLKDAGDKSIYAADSFKGMTANLKKMEDEYKSLSKEERETFGVDLKNRISATKNEIKTFNTELKSTDTASDSMKGLSKNLKVLEDEYKNLSKEQRETFGKELKDNILNTRLELKELESDLGDHRRNVGNYKGSLQGSFDQLGDSFKNLSLMVAAAAFDMAKDTVKAVADITREFKVLRGEIQLLTGATGDDLDRFTVKIASIGKTFGAETDEILKAANSLTKNLTGDFDESLRLIQDGFLSGANTSGSFLSSLEELSPIMAKTGVSADQFIGVMSQSAKDGIFSTKGTDAIAEAGLKLREQTGKTQKAVKDLFGESEGLELLGQIDTGEITLMEAIQKVSTKMGELPPQSAVVGKAMAGIFGGAGEAAGLDFLKSLKDIDSETSSYIDTTNELTRSQLAQLSAEEMLAEAQNEVAKRFSIMVDGAGNLSTIIQGYLLTALVYLYDAFEPIGLALQEVGTKISDFLVKLGLVSKEGGYMTLMMNSLKSTFNFLGASITFVIDLVGYLINGLVYLYDNFAPVTMVVNTLRNTFVLLQSALQSLPATYNGLVAATKQLGTNMSAFFSALLIDAQILAKSIEAAFSIKESTNQRIKAEVAALKAQKGVLAAEGRSIGAAFTDAFNTSLADIDAKAALNKVNIEEPAKDIGSRGGAALEDGLANGIKGDKVSKKIVQGVSEALEKVLVEGSVDALREKTTELNKVLSGLAPNTELYLETAKKVKEATELLNEAEEIRKEALLTDEQILKAKTENAAKVQAALDKALADELTAKKLGIDLLVAEERLAAQKIRDVKLANDNLTNEERKAIVEEYNKTLAASELKAEQDRLALLQEGSLERLNLQAKIANSELAIREGLYAQDVALSLKAEQEKEQNRKRFQDIALQAAQAISDTAFTIMQSNLDRETEAQIERIDRDTEARLESASYSEEEQVRIKQEAEEQKRAIEVKAAKERKAQAILQAIINGALAAITTLANTTIPYPAAFALLIPTAIAVASEIAVISATKFAQGKSPTSRKASRGMIASGRSHAQGGIPAVIDGQELVEIEGDEAIIAKAATYKHLQLLSDANQDVGGIRFEGTKPLNAERRKRLNLYDSVARERPNLAAGGLAPRINSLIDRKRKFETGGLASVEGMNVAIPSSNLSDRDVELIALAAARGTKAGIEQANLFENFKRQSEREEELKERAKI